MQARLEARPTYAEAARRLGIWRFAGQAVTHLILLLFALAAALPFLWMVFGSFKEYKELTSSMALLPQNWTLDNYDQIIGRVNFLNAFRNSIIVAVITTACVMLTSSAAGYVLAKYRFPGKELIFTLILATLMIPFAVVIIPLYVFISDIGAMDQLAGIILPGMWSTFGIFLMRQFMEGIPSELLDAARIDGASEWRIYSQLMVPLAGAPLAALAILTFLGSWDSFLWPSLVLNSPDKQTIPLVLAGLRSLYWSRYDLYMAGSMLTVVPVMLVYLFASKHFIRGIALTGLKG
jgi:multiple sugar transport system permease protein